MSLISAALNPEAVDDRHGAATVITPAGVSQELREKQSWDRMPSEREEVALPEARAAGSTSIRVSNAGPPL